LIRKCSTGYGTNINLDKVVSVGFGEKAMPVQDGSKDWIVPYAGKWYPRSMPSIPNTTEIITVYGEYFSNREKLIQLMQYDPFMVRFMAFVLMGGPVAAMQALDSLKRREALNQLDQRDRRANGYDYRRSGGGGRGGSGGYKPKKSKGFGL
jgi:hypothetical protein